MIFLSELKALCSIKKENIGKKMIVKGKVFNTKKLPDNYAICDMLIKNIKTSRDLSYISNTFLTVFGRSLVIQLTPSAVRWLMSIDPYFELHSKKIFWGEFDYKVYFHTNKTKKSMILNGRAFRDLNETLSSPAGSPVADHLLIPHLSMFMNEGLFRIFEQKKKDQKDQKDQKHQKRTKRTPLDKQLVISHLEAFSNQMV